MLDYSLPYLSGLELLIEAKKYNSYNYGILFTNDSDKELLEKSLNKTLVSKCIQKPIDFDYLKQSIDNAIFECYSFKNEYSKDKYSKIVEKFGIKENTIIGIDNSLKKIHDEVRKISKIPINVLITGETGTGKELIAHEIHNLSSQSKGPFIKINCSALPDTLFESELFGVVKGAYTGANDKIGKIELAHGGTLFLDEIGEMKPELQAKLLRVLQTKEIERLGSNKTVKVDFRLITATNKDLNELIIEKKFRNDLYYRINEFQIHLPPLRERVDDIKDLLIFFLKKYCIELNIPFPFVTSESLEFLKNYHWEGNIREFENTIKRVLIKYIDNKVILPIHFNFFKKNIIHKNYHEHDYHKSLDVITSVIIDKKLPFKDLEKDVLNKILKMSNNKISEAVKKSGISKNKFYRKVSL